MTWRERKINEQLETKDKLPNRKLNRLAGFNYAETGRYFVTICTADGSHAFGRVINGIMELNDTGGIVSEQFMELEEHYKTVSIDCFAVMPNHVHAIVMINGTPGIIKPLPVIMQAYKSLSSRKIREKDKGFKWQRSYYDRIIKTEYGLERVREYIKSNPANWNKDAENAVLKLDRRKYYQEIAEEIKEKINERIL